MSDAPKAIISKRLYDLLGWHCWTVISLSGTVSLLVLNFREYAIGGELGADSGSSANILGALQLVIKLHELAITANVFGIAQQWILSDLLAGGLLLGLLGAEWSLSTPSFLISQSYRLTLTYAAQGILATNGEMRPDRARRLRMLWLALFMFLACVICSLAGPASGVLMIPRVEWFLHQQLKFKASNRGTIPNIMIGTATGQIDGVAFSESNVLTIPGGFVGLGLDYWTNFVDTVRNNIRPPEELSVHKFLDFDGDMFVNTTGSGNRELSAEWSGGTRITTAFKRAGMFNGTTTVSELRDVRSGWKGLKATRSTHGLDAWVTCRAREKIACDSLAGNQSDVMIFGNRSEPVWCYLNVNKENNTGTLRTSKNLLLSYEGPEDRGEPRVWITEGPRTDRSSHYSDSIEVVFEKSAIDPKSVVEGRFTYGLTVCSFSGMLVAAVSTSYGVLYSAEQVEYLDHVVLANGSTAPPRKLLFHKNWLDRAYGFDPNVPYSYYANYSIPEESMIYPDNFTYPTRPGTTPTNNTFGLFGWHIALVPMFERVDKPGLAPARREAFQVEMVVGGALTYMLSWIFPSDSEYSMSYDQIPDEFRLGQKESWPIEYVWTLYTEGYGFRLSSRTGYLGVVVLVLHAVIAIGAWLWQLIMRRKVIRAWNSVSDYTLLGAGSPSLVMAYPNTCAGISGEGALQSLVVVGETIPPPGAATTPHLELVSVEHAAQTATTPVDSTTAKRYGFRGGRREKMKME